MSDQPTRRTGTGEDQTVSKLREVWHDAATHGGRLPGEVNLAEMMGVSRPSLREALVRLEEDGLIYRRHGAETTVNRAALEISTRFDHHADFMQVLRDAGFTPKQELIRAERVRLSDHEAATFGVEPGTDGMRIVKRWRADGTPARVASDLFPLMGGEPEFDLNESLITLLEALRGEPVRWELVVPSASNADDDLASWLEVQVGAALLTLDCVGVTSSGGRAYQSVEYFAPGVVRQGLIRVVG